MKGSKWTAVFAFFVGASLGVLAGMLFAPKSGEELREDLTDRLNEGAHRVRAASRSVARRAGDIASHMQESVSDMASDVADAGLRAARKITRS